MAEYHVEPYAVQKAKGKANPRGICPGCESNYTLRADNCMRAHKVRGLRCSGSEQPSLGLPNRLQYY